MLYIILRNCHRYLGIGQWPTNKLASIMCEIIWYSSGGGIERVCSFFLYFPLSLPGNIRKKGGWVDS